MAAQRTDSSISVTAFIKGAMSPGVARKASLEAGNRFHTNQGVRMVEYKGDQVVAVDCS